jgi:hypothetical protein
LTAVLAVGLASLATVAPAVAQEKKPNILFISLVRTAHVSSLDNPERLLNLPRRNECAPNSGLRAILFYRDRRVSSSSSRPTSSIKPPACRASKRLSTEAGRRTA